MKCHAVEEVSSKLGSGTMLLGRGPVEHDELGAELLVLEELEMVELEVIILELEEETELLVEEGALDDEEETVELVIVELDEIEDEVEDTTEELDEALELVETIDDEETVELVDGAAEGVDEVDENEEDVEDTTDELDGALELVDTMLQDVLEVTDGAQYWASTTALFIVTIPPRPNNDPYTTEAVFAVTETAARTCPWNTVPTPSVADEPICQYTLQAWAPPARMTDAPEPVTRVLPIWKIQVSEGEPVPARVRTPPAAMLAELEYLYIPGLRVWPARLPISSVAPLIATIWLYTAFPAVKAD